MKYDVIKKDLYTESGVFIKTLHCPYKMNWNELKKTNLVDRKCSNCDHLIIDTKYQTDEQLLKLISKNPNTCFKIDFGQNNVKLISNGILEQK